MTQMLFRTIFLGAICTLLCGCIEISADAKFDSSGAASISAEIGVTPELVALSDNPEVAKQSGGFAALLKECNQPLPQADLPKGVTSVSRRAGQKNGLLTCTFTAEISDPVTAFADAETRKGKIGGDTAPPFTFERLASGNGYRVRGELTNPSKMPPLPSGEGAPLAMAMISKMFENRFITITIAGQRVENTTGEVLPDGKSVRWKFPLTILLLPGGMPPQKIEADVVFYETWWTKWSRKLFG